MVLRTSVLLRDLAPADLAHVIATGRPYQVRAGAFFFHQDAPARWLYVLTAGRVKFSQITPAGVLVLVRVGGPGDPFGAVAVLGDALHPASAQAVGPCTALGWESAVISTLLEAHPRLALNTVRFLAERVRELQDRYRELATQQAAQRRAHALLRLAAQLGRPVAAGVLLDLPLTRQDLAELTGTTLFTASRTLRRWEQAGLIQSGRARILIRDLAALHALAETPAGVESAGAPASLR